VADLFLLQLPEYLLFRNYHPYRIVLIKLFPGQENLIMKAKWIRRKDSSKRTSQIDGNFGEYDRIRLNLKKRKNQKGESLSLHRWVN
jgi:hypothetical protein